MFPIFKDSWNHNGSQIVLCSYDLLEWQPEEQNVGKCKKSIPTWLIDLNGNVSIIMMLG